MELAAGVDPVLLAHELGARYRGQTGPDGRFHHFEFPRPLAGASDPAALASIVQRSIAARSAAIIWSEQQVRRPRTTRSFVRPADPSFTAQWHLENIGQARGRPGVDTGILPVWGEGYTGAGVQVVVVDTGTDIHHPDLAPNYLGGSDVYGGSPTPEPGHHADGHGTAVSGIIAAARNGRYGVGIAYGSRFAAVRLLSGEHNAPSAVTDAQEAEALAFDHPTAAIYNNSWGPGSRQQVRFAAPGTQVRETLRAGIHSGRAGRGAIYVWAAGNAADIGDNANYDGYANSIHTIAVAAIGHDGKYTDYSEPGACLLVAAPSRGGGAGILTTDPVGMRGYSSDDMYANFGGTSAAAPMVSGVVALLLQARPELGWRDVQFILARSAVRTDPDHPDWRRNGAGLYVNHHYGFGRVDARAAVALARAWAPLPAEYPVESSEGSLNLPLPAAGWLERVATVADDLAIRAVEVEISSDHGDWADLEIELVAPAGTVSRLCEPDADSTRGRASPGTWTFTSMRHLDEPAAGAWRLRLADRGPRASGRLHGWTLRLHGHATAAGANRPPHGPDLEIVSGAFPVSIDLLAGMTDPDGDDLAIISLQPPAYGTMTEIGADRVQFTAGPAADGWDRFGVTVTDGHGGVAHRVVRIFDERPIAMDDAAVTGPAQPVVIDLLHNDVQPGSIIPELLDVAQPRHGWVEPQAGGSVRYTPDPGHAGVDRFSYLLAGGTQGWVTVSTEAGNPDRALAFDGVDDHVRIAAENLPGLAGPFTIEAWIQPTGFGEFSTGFGRIFDKEQIIFFLNGADHLYYQDASLVLFMTLANGAGGTVSSAANSPANSVRLHAWQHVAVRFQPGAAEPVAFYVDGVELAAAYPASNAPRPPTGAHVAGNASAALYIGESANQARAFQGAITELRYWRAARSATAIAAGSLWRLSGAEPDLLLYYPFREGVGRETWGLGENPAAGSIHGARWRPRLPAWQPFVDAFRPDQAHGSGWYWLRGYGWLHGDRMPWIAHATRGWLYALGGPDGHWFWQADTGWFFTAPLLYPWVLQVADGLDGTWHYDDPPEPP
jgi:subtilisin family serine protease